MALAAQALEAQKASKPLEQGGALEQVAARMKRVMGLTFDMRGADRLAGQRPLDGRVSRLSAQWAKAIGVRSRRGAAWLLQAV